MPLNLVTVAGLVVVLAALAQLTIGLVGALPPAFRCLRLPIPEALKTV